MASYNASDLLTRLLQNDPDVFRHLYRTYGGMIAAYVRKNSGNDDDARDVVQVVMVQFWQAVSDGRYTEEGKLDRYLYQLAANTWRMELRRRRRQPAQYIDTQDALTHLRDEAPEALAWAVVKDDGLNAMHRALETMDEPCQSIIRLYHLQEVALQEVAERMQYDYNNLRKRIFDCRKKLKHLTTQLMQAAQR